jgi:hypothetical protein
MLWPRLYLVLCLLAAVAGFSLALFLALGGRSHG